jgi:dephospho-CoA kinase
MLVILITGQMRAGKNTLMQCLGECFPAIPMYRIGFSDSVRKVLGIFDVPPTRPNYSEFSSALKSTPSYGPDILRRAVKIELQKLKDFDGIALVHGLRYVKDIEVAQGFRLRLIGIVADEGVRFVRAKRGPKDMCATLEEFRQAEKAETEGEVAELLKFADFTVSNSGSLSEFNSQVEALAKELYSLL